MNSESSSCPKCGYPTCFNGNKYYGVYFPGSSCDNCGYVDEVAKNKMKWEIESEKAAKERRANYRPVFKSVEDWENYEE